jgi:hypothetical protein
MKRGAAFLFALFGFASLAVAADKVLHLGLPVGCEEGKTCWVVNYPDTTTSPPARDFRCGPRTYDDHDGTDFATADRHAMEAGVPVLAAAAGEVVSARDGEAAGTYLALGPGAVERRECGNGVILKHGRWRTQYCHMRNGSVAVKPGQKVVQGQTLGLIGLSGRTEFPHLHLTVRRFGLVVDPFTGKTLGGGCAGGEAAAPLWQPKAAIAYRETAIYAAASPRVRRARKRSRPTSRCRRRGRGQNRSGRLGGGLRLRSRHALFGGACGARRRHPRQPFR